MFKTAMATSLVALLATSGVALAQAQKDAAPGGAGAERSAPPTGGASGAAGGAGATRSDAPGKTGAPGQTDAPGKMTAPGKSEGAAKDRSAQSEPRKDGRAGDANESRKDLSKDAARSGEGKESPRAGGTKADDAKADRAKSAETKADDAKSNQTKGDRAADRKDAQKADDRKDDARTGDAAPKAGETKQDSAGTKGGDDARQLSRNWKPEQRTRVRTVFAKHRREAVVNINIQPRVGISIPRSVKLVSIPQDLIVIVPEYREYRYFIVDNAAYIVDPDTFVIVDVVQLV